VPCRTHEVPLGHPADVSALPAPPGVGDRSRTHLASRYGLFAEQVLKLCAERPELAEPIVPGHPDVLAEAVVAARHEQARSVADVLLRRTRLGLLAARRLATEPERADAVARALGGELGWDDARVRHEQEAWLQALAGEGLVVEGQPSEELSAIR